MVDEYEVGLTYTRQKRVQKSDEVQKSRGILAIGHDHLTLHIKQTGGPVGHAWKYLSKKKSLTCFENVFMLCVAILSSKGGGMVGRIMGIWYLIVSFTCGEL